MEVFSRPLKFSKTVSNDWKTNNHIRKDSSSIIKRECNQKRRAISQDDVRIKSKSRFNKKMIFNRLIATQKNYKASMTPIMTHVTEGTNSIPRSLMTSPKGGQCNQIALTQFTREFSLFCFELDHDRTGFFNYMKFCSLLNKLRFIEDPFDKSDQERELILKAWKIVGGNQERKVKIDTIYSFLLGVMGLSMKNEFITSGKKISKSTKFITYSSRHKKQELHLEFILLYKNRTCKKKEESIRIEILEIPPTHCENLENNCSASMIISETQEKLDVIDVENNFPRKKFESKRVIRRVSLEDMLSNPHQLFPKQLTNSNNLLHISDTLKNISLANSDSDDATKVSKVLTLPLDLDLNYSFFNRLKVQVFSSKNNESYRKDNQSLSCKISTKKTDEKVAYNHRGSHLVQMLTVESRKSSITSACLDKDELVAPKSGRKSNLELKKQKTHQESVKPPRTPIATSSKSFFN